MHVCSLPFCQVVELPAAGVSILYMTLYCRQTRADVTRTAEILAAEKQRLLDQVLSNTSDIKLRRLLDITQQLGQTSLTLSLTKSQTINKPAMTQNAQRSTMIHELAAQ